MWNVAETQFAIISGDQARQRAAARGEQITRAANRANRDYERSPHRRPPDTNVAAQRAATA